MAMGWGIAHSCGARKLISNWIYQLLAIWPVVMARMSQQGLGLRFMVELGNRDNSWAIEIIIVFFNDFKINRILRDVK